MLDDPEGQLLSTPSLQMPTPSGDGSSATPYLDSLPPLGQRRRRVALVGFAVSSRSLAPYRDGRYEIWGLNELYHHIPRWDRWFQMHDVDQMRNAIRDEKHWEWLRTCKVPVYTLSVVPEIPTSVAYPLAEVMRHFGIDEHAPGASYFTCSGAYQIALALYEGMEEIHLYGYDLALNTEYAMTKAAIEFWLGVARGRGAKVVLPDVCPMLRTPRLYGYEVPEPLGRISIARLEARFGKLETESTQLAANLQTQDGAIQEITHWMGSGQLTPDGQAAAAARLAQLHRGREQYVSNYQATQGALQEVYHWMSVLQTGVDTDARVLEYQAAERVAAAGGALPLSSDGTAATVAPTNGVPKRTSLRRTPDQVIAAETRARLETATP